MVTNDKNKTVGTDSASAAAVSPPHYPTVPSVPSSVVIGQVITIDLSSAGGIRYTHDLRYRTPSGGGTIATGVYPAQSPSWRVPDFSAAIPNAAVGTVTIYCTTYDEDGYGLGTKTVTMTASVPTNVLPIIRSVTVTESVAGLAEKYKAFVQNKSKPKVSIVAEGAWGSTITSITATLEGKTYTGSSWTAGSVLAGSGEIPLQITVTDSRGRALKATKTISVLAYAPPVISRLSASRCDAKGAAADDGAYAKLSYAYSAPSLNGGNTVAMTVKAKKSTESSYTVDLLSGSALTADTSTVPQTALSIDYRWDIQLSVRDSFGAVTTATVQLPSADVIMDFKADGTGMAIGKTAERKGLEIADGFTVIGEIVQFQYSSGVWSGPVIALYKGDGNGCGLVIGAGGRTIIGSGEAAQNLRLALGTDGVRDAYEEMHIAGDDFVQVHTNCQGDAKARKTFTFKADGSFEANLVKAGLKPVNYTTQTQYSSQKVEFKIDTGAIPFFQFSGMTGSKMDSCNFGLDTNKGLFFYNAFLKGAGAGNGTFYTTHDPPPSLAKGYDLLATVTSFKDGMETVLTLPHPVNDYMMLVTDLQWRVSSSGTPLSNMSTLFVPMLDTSREYIISREPATGSTSSIVSCKIKVPDKTKASLTVSYDNTSYSAQTLKIYGVK